MTFLPLFRHSGVRTKSPSPESIFTIRGYGFRAPRFARPRNDESNSCLYPAHLANELPLIGRHRLHRQAGVVDQHHLLQARRGPGFHQRDRLLERLDRLDVDDDPGFAGFGGRIGIMLADHLGDADDLLAFAGVIEESALALFHLHQVELGLVIAHAAPRLALGAARDLIVPGERAGLGLQQPIRHDHSSDFKGRASNDSIAASTLSFSSSSAATAAAIGMSTQRSRALSSSTGAVKAPSARPVVRWIVSGLAPRPRLTPKLKLRDCGLEQVNSKSPSPDRPIMV